jgi:aspartate carbamoyltransferase catalytic subunit
MPVSAQQKSSTSAAVSPRRHLLGLDGMAKEELLDIIAEAEGYLPVVNRQSPHLAHLRGRIVANLFLEDSTRTRCSFAAAAMKLGGQTIDLSAAGSSVSKGETLVDTARNIEAMGVDCLVIRCTPAGGPHAVARAVNIPVLNAGDGKHEHPTQGLLDIMTMLQVVGPDLAGKRIAIVGDIASSRVARSNIFGLVTLGAQILLVGPPSLVPSTFKEIAAGPGHVEITHELDPILSEIDAIMMLRVQFERHGKTAVTEDYRSLFGLDESRASRLRPGVRIFHPGPVNRGFELDAAVADDPGRSVLMQQVTNGVAIRMACLRRLVAS